MRSPIALALAALVALGTFASCGSDKAEEPQPVVSLEPVRQLVVEIAGQRTARFTGQAKLKVITRKGQREQLQIAAAAIEPMDKLNIDANTYLKPEIGLSGMYKGDGTYTIPAGVGPAPSTGSTVPAPQGGTTGLSVAAISIVDTSKTPPADIRFGYVLEPCRVTLRNNATEGEAHCPALVAFTGERVSFTYSWSA